MLTTRIPAQTAGVAIRTTGQLFPLDHRTLRDDARPSLSRVLAAFHVGDEAVDGLIEHLPVSVAVTDRNGRLTYANAAARALPLADLPEIQTVVAQALLTGEEIGEVRCEYCGSDGSRRWLTLTAAPLRGANGGTAGASVTLVDVTEHIQATEWRPLIDSLATL